ncbi:FKBP-type peptidyl-prolyl cis-trans isomerase [Flavobacterium sp. ARAG 55.4]|uniref:FKBP-type peptidyl-prolyl cis-trans isomerase n=1 Tax=Flavobacterium sp. ARAG 55.4 TaxID=3451357 RepID=UPI003F459FCB
MNKFRYYFILIITTLSLFSCSKDDNTIEEVPLRDFGEQYAKDNDSIEKYLNNYYIEEITDAPGQPEDQDIKMTKIPEGGTQAPIMSLLNSPTFPKLLIRSIKLHEITYNIYYLVLREGVGEKPCDVDGIFATYKGTLLNETIFDQSFDPQRLWVLDPNAGTGSVFVEGWRQIFPQFRTGTYTESGLGDGTLTYYDFGAGVMFLPSGVAYYGSGQGSIPAYTPIVFSFKLYELRRYDQDNDGIPSYLEDIDGDGYVRTLPGGDSSTDDSDGDGIPDYFDADDDGDGFLTRREITVNGKLIPFESIPDCSGNTTNPDRKKKYLDKNCY